MQFGSFILSFFVATCAHAQSSGLTAIKANEIRMSEYLYDEQSYENREVRKIKNPNFRIFLKGEEAAKLQQILPSERSVLTSMYPDIAREYNATFKALGIYNEEIQDRNRRMLVSSKVLTITCNSGKLEYSDNGSRPRIIPSDVSECEIMIRGVGKEGEFSDYLGAMDSFDPEEVCRQ